MSNLHPKAKTGEFLPSVRQMTLIDANMELNGVINHAVKTLFPDDMLGEERDFMMRGILIRLQALTDVMYAAACSTDDELRHYLNAAYAKHHSFTETPATDIIQEAAHA